MSILIIYSFNDAVKQSYLYNAYVLKFMDDNDSDDTVNKDLF
jgi:hypothetical protein